MKQQASLEYLFVYGTLHRLAENSQYYRIEGYCELVGKGKMQGKLFRVNDYPGAILSEHGTDKVYGDVYRIRGAEKVLTILDHYEECSAQFPLPHEYVRRQWPIVLQNGEVVRAWVYLYNYSTTNLEPILLGSFIGDQ
jgi:gamma-glutamylcyclotransferase (GGCT)/AIG2-like uncharacterized protein YtfP